MSTELNNLKVFTDLEFKQKINESQKAVGYINRKDTPLGIYAKLGFMCGLEVHQQLLTKGKLFCRCPAGIYQQDDDFDAEVIRHMRPTLSELGEYDGTALMEFRTKKNIVYRLKNKTACTYEVDDTPPFKIDNEALENALQIALQLKTKIVGELHIARKQYLDGSIPTGFQRTGIVGIEGEIPLKNKIVRIIQISIEEDSCREVSDIGHWRTYMTDRLGMPLIETVTYPDMKTPDEAAEAGYYISYLARSSNVVRTGSGAGRQDVNVSITGGHRVEIKGVSHINWIPELTHNEAFRQKALLQIKDKLNRISSKDKWKLSSKKLNSEDLLEIKLNHSVNQNLEYHLVKLPNCAEILPYFTQPGHCFADELSGRLKVIACIEKPNMQFVNLPSSLIGKLNPSAKDIVILIWGPSEDIPTALETIEERIHLAFDGVPDETRKSFPDGTTIFERVLPGANRMYPDTDSAPIPITEELINDITSRLPKEVVGYQKKLVDWGIPDDCHGYILRRNLVPIIEKIINDFSWDSKFIGCIIGHRLKRIEGRWRVFFNQDYQFLYDLVEFINEQKLEKDIIFKLLPMAYSSPDTPLSKLLEETRFKQLTKKDITDNISKLKINFIQNKRTYPSSKYALENSLMGQLRNIALGNISLKLLSEEIKKEVANG